jgi:hypothetical protein
VRVRARAGDCVTVLRGCPYKLTPEAPGTSVLVLFNESSAEDRALRPAEAGGGAGKVRAAVPTAVATPASDAWRARRHHPAARSRGF